MDQKKLKKDVFVLSLISTILFVAGIAILYSLYTVAHASEIIYTETTPTEEFSGVSEFFGRLQSPDVPHWYVDEIEFYISDISIFSGTPTVRGTIRDASGTVASSTASKTLVEGWNTFTFTTPVPVQNISSTDIRIGMTVVSGSFSYHSYTTGTTTGGPMSYFDTFGNSTANNPVMVVWGIDTDNPLYTDTRTRIVSQTSPANGATLPDEIATFEFTYFVNDTTDPTLDTAGVEIKDLTNGFEYVPLTEAISASGLSSFSDIAQVQTGHLHMWRPFLSDENGQRYFGDWYSFDVVSASAPFEQIPTDATSTATVRFFGLGGYLATKFPFAYLYDIKHAIDNAGTSSRSFPELTIAVGTSSPFQLDATVLSSSTISTYVSDGQRTIFRGLIEVALWISFISMIYFTIKRQF